MDFCLAIVSRDVSTMMVPAGSQAGRNRKSQKVALQPCPGKVGFGVWRFAEAVGTTLAGDLRVGPGFWKELKWMKIMGLYFMIFYVRRFGQYSCSWFCYPLLLLLAHVQTIFVRHWDTKPDHPQVMEPFRRPGRRFPLLGPHLAPSAAPRNGGDVEGQTAQVSQGLGRCLDGKGLEHLGTCMTFYDLYSLE